MPTSTAHLDYPVHTRTLPNGMRIIVSPDRSTPVVAMNLWYGVGSADETPGHTGFAHLFEHVMFQGSTNVRSGEHLAAIQAAGGTCNATTWFDRTAYFETVPKGALDLALWLESDRMAGLLDALTQSNLDNQRDVVKEEKRQRYDNAPYGDLMERLLPLVFPAGHPYGHPTIGSMADLDAASLEDTQAFFRRWYTPDNAVISLVGDVEPADAFDRIERYFGALGPGERTARPDVGALPRIAGVPSARAVAPVPASTLYTAWRLPPQGTRELDACDIALDILGGSQTSRLYRRLVRDDESASAAGAAAIQLARGTSMGYALGRALDGVSLDTIGEALVDELDRLAEDGPTQEEIDRAHVQFEREWLSRCARLDARADLFSAHMTLFNDPGIVNRRVSDYCSVTRDEAIAAIQSTLRSDQRAVLSYERGSFQED